MNMELKMGILERMLRAYCIALAAGTGILSAVWLSSWTGVMQHIIDAVKGAL